MLGVGSGAQRGAVATHVRGTVIGSSLRAVRDHGLEPRYFDLLAPEHREAVRALIPQSWVPMRVAQAHYRVLDALYDEAGARANGRRVAERVQHAHLRTVLRALGAVGIVSPELVVERSGALVERMLKGGTVAVRTAGRRGAAVTLHGCPLADIGYFRHGCEGIFVASLELVADEVSARSLLLGVDSVAFHLSW